jgi:hypothetical protein
MKLEETLTSEDSDLWRLGDVALWVEQGSSIQLKAVTGFGDPVELSTDEARQVAQALLQHADRADES